MLARSLRIALTFVVVAAAYWVYALTVVPLVEPRTALVKKSESGPPVDLPPDPISRRKDLLAQLFAPGSWELGQPKILESEQAMLLVDNYRNLPDGKVELAPCTVVFFPDGFPSAEAPQRRSVILQAPKGAVLQFDQPFDLRRAKVGRLVGGQMPGQITIYSGPGGAADQELRIVTRDVRLNDQRLWTPAAVEFQLGGNRGSGRALEISLDKRDESAPAKRQPTLGSIRSFQLLHDVKLHLELKGGLLGEKPKPGRTVRPQPPVEISSRGPLRFDLAENVATFHDQVDVLVLNPQGPTDQMTCERLSLIFARKAPAGGGNASSANRVKLEAQAVEAVGNPVIIRAPSQGANIRCQRLRYEIGSGRITLDGNDDVSLRQGESEVRSRHVDYLPGGSGRMGKLLASGPGSLQGTLPNDPRQKFQARWKSELRLRPHGPNQLISLRGDAEVRMTEFGLLAADELHLWLNELTPRTAARPIDGQPPIVLRQVQPDRLMAAGKVRIDAPQLTGGVERLEVWFDLAGAASAGAAAAAQGVFRPASLAAPSRQRFQVGGALARLVVAVVDGQAQASEVTLDGGAHFSELASSGQAPPLRVAGERVRVVRAQSPDAAVRVDGQPAQIEARGMKLSGSRIQLDRGSNRMWIDGAGKTTVTADRDLDGRPIARPQPVEVTWKGGMSFDGRTCEFDRSVVVGTAQQLLKADKVELALKQRIDFTAATTKGQPRPEVELVRCGGKFSIESRTLDAKGLAAVDQVEGSDLSVNQTTGVLEARGPGWLRSVRRDGPKGVSLGSFTGGSSPPPTASGKLTYVYVQFQRAASGNVLPGRRELTFSNRVKSVYGRVADWNDRIDHDDPDRLGLDGALLTCEQLTLRDAPGAAGASPGAIELEAQGSTVVEGQSFTARAHRITYTQAKDLLVMEGDGRSDAELFLQTAPGAQPIRQPARRMMFWPATRRIEVDAAGAVDSGPLPARPIRRPGG